MGVEVFVAPGMSADDFSGLDATAAAAVLAGVVSTGDYVSSFVDGHHGIELSLAVTEDGAEVVAVRASPWTFTNETFHPFGCQNSFMDLNAKASWLK